MNNNDSDGYEVRVVRDKKIVSELLKKTLMHRELHRRDKWAERWSSKPVEIDRNRKVAGTVWRKMMNELRDKE